MARNTRMARNAHKDIASSSLGSLAEAIDALWDATDEAETMAAATDHVQDLTSRLWEMVHEARKEGRA